MSLQLLEVLELSRKHFMYLVILSLHSPEQLKGVSGKKFTMTSRTIMVEGK
jgi:hypothetical protein